uniref:Uncharacterized protein n=1 Tax=Musca domestica TaxID=7370 RepID=A0A1I8NIY2_MUSDO
KFSLLQKFKKNPKVVPKLTYFCPKGKFTCRDFSCISIVHRCDGQADCPQDRSDEEGCPCLHDKWQCDDGTCISKELRCNGNIDCPEDISDERRCHGELIKISRRKK